MAKRTRQKHSAVFRAKVALASLTGDKMLAELSQQFEVYPNQKITQWKRQLSERTAGVFDGGKATEPSIDLKSLHAKIGQLEVGE